MTNVLRNFSSKALLNYVNESLPGEDGLGLEHIDRSLKIYNSIVGASRPRDVRVNALIRVSEMQNLKDIGEVTANRMVNAGTLEALGALTSLPNIGPKTFARLVWSLAKVKNVDDVWDEEDEDFPEETEITDDFLVGETETFTPAPLNYESMTDSSLARHLTAVLGEEIPKQFGYRDIRHALKNYNTFMTAGLNPGDLNSVLLKVTEIPKVVNIGAKQAEQLRMLGTVNRLGDLKTITSLGDKIFARLVWKLSQIENTASAIKETWPEIEASRAKTLGRENEEVLSQTVNRLLEGDLGTILDAAGLTRALDNFNAIAGADLPFDSRLNVLLASTEIPDKKDIGPVLGTRLLKLHHAARLEYLDAVPGITPVYFARLVWKLRSKTWKPC